MEEQTGWMRRSDLADELDVGVRTLVRWAQHGYGPPPVKIGLRAVRYRRSDVDAFLVERATDRHAS